MMTKEDIEFLYRYRVCKIKDCLKKRFLNPDIAEFFWATCIRYKEVNFGKKI